MIRGFRIGKLRGWVGGGGGQHPVHYAKESYGISEGLDNSQQGGARGSGFLSCTHRLLVPKAILDTRHGVGTARQQTLCICSRVL